MSASNSYPVDLFDRERELQRLHVQARLSWEQEARALTRFGLTDGMAVLELGSGPGFVTEALLTLLPHSTITAVEIAPVMLQQAQRYLADKGSQRVRFLETSVLDTGLPTESADFALARLLFQHLPDPVAAAKEAFRVLKPGGKLVVLDIDQDLDGVRDPSPSLASLERARRGADQQAARGGNRSVGRRLWRMLRAAGFEQLELEGVMVHSDALGMEAFVPLLAPDPVAAAPRIKAGLITEEEFTQAQEAWEHFLAAPEPYVLLLLFAACGTKPEGTGRTT